MYAIRSYYASGDLRSQNRQAIEETLSACKGCVTEAARRLGIHRSTIYRQLARSHH